jgi:RNA polymerase sigma-70 factor (ECF subfamily)
VNEAHALAAWRALEARLRPFVSRRVGPVDAEDVLQEIFMRLQRGLPRLRDNERLVPWIFLLARSAIVDHVRALARTPLVTAEPPDTPACHVDGDDEDRDIERAVASHLEVLLTALPPLYRQALMLTELGGLSQRAAAARLGLSFSGMKSRVQRARGKLREMLEDSCEVALDVRGRVVGCEPREGATIRCVGCD